jgi:hypothetical protein
MIMPGRNQPEGTKNRLMVSIFGFLTKLKTSQSGVPGRLCDRQQIDNVSWIFLPGKNSKSRLPGPEMVISNVPDSQEDVRADYRGPDQLPED